MNELTRLTGDMSGVYGTPGAPASIRAAARGSFPAMNLGATDDEVYVYAFAPGLDPSSLDISIQRSLLTLAGERKVERAENADYYLEERFCGRFRRVISVPDDIRGLYADVRGSRFRRTFSLSPELDTEHVSADLRDGVLRLQIAKRAELKPRRIELKSD